MGEKIFLPQPMVHIYQPSQFLIVRHAVYNSLQFFQGLVILQCSGQSYGSSVSQVIVSEATVRCNHMTELDLQ